jgi:hypothetical protein
MANSWIIPQSAIRAMNVSVLMEFEGKIQDFWKWSNSGRCSRPKYDHVFLFCYSVFTHLSVLDNLPWTQVNILIWLLMCCLREETSLSESGIFRLVECFARLLICRGEAEVLFHLSNFSKWKDKLKSAGLLHSSGICSCGPDLTEWERLRVVCYRCNFYIDPIEGFTPCYPPYFLCYPTTRTTRYRLCGRMGLGGGINVGVTLFRIMVSIILYELELIPSPPAHD